MDCPLIGAALMLASAFLPYAVAKDGSGVEAVSQAIGTDMSKPSMVTFTRVYMDNAGQYVASSQAYVTLVVTMAIVLFAVLTLLFAALRKPIAAMIFDILAGLAFLAQNFDFSARGVVPSGNYSWGISYYLMFAAIVVALIGSIWLFVAKRRIPA
ncbi:hypothetical protein [Bifidobacterium oedipodis]|uniref:hypothetical protein n=1 Tax=Bifidobacterium oedipodis TaxID=2675322 RepID=UPI00145EBD6F|nr:hypothetical protein [Bifidobacterium sp. DSM 109957]